MIERYRHPNDKEELPKGYRNLSHSALKYVQPAIENGGVTSQDATQNLVNNIINKRK